MQSDVTWSDYALVGTTFQIVGESLCEALDLRSGMRVLDVAAGNGSASLAAARRWCDVTSSEDVASLLEAGRRRAQAEGHIIKFQEADAEELPFAGGSFDAVLSSFGVMFAPDQEQAARELMRVCRRSGRIGLANWTPESFIGQLFGVIGRYLPPTAASPLLWGTRPRLDSLFAAGARSIVAVRREFVFRYRSPLHWVEMFRTYYGPLNKTFAALDPPQQAAFTSELLDLIEAANRSGDRSLVLPSEYLEVVIEKR